MTSTHSWRASFVGPTRSAEPGEPAPYFRREFTVEDGLHRATLHVTALGIVEAQLNGVRVGDEVLAPGWTSYRHRMNVRNHDVTGLITTGANVDFGQNLVGWVRIAVTGDPGSTVTAR